MSWLEAAAGNESLAQAALRQFFAANSGLSPFVLERQQVLNTALLALRHSDRDAASRVLPDMRFPTGVGVRHWVIDYFPLFVRGRIWLLVNDYASAERDFKTVIRSVRVFANYGALLQRMPLVERLCHFYLGQINETTGKRDDAIREYRSFLSHYVNSRSRLPQIAEARASLRRLGG